MFLALRMALYAIGGFLAGQGFDFFTFDQATGDVVIAFNIDSLATFLAGSGVFAGTFVWSFWDDEHGPAAKGQADA